MKKFILAILMALIIVPSIALASWWNPFTWKIFNKKEITSVGPLLRSGVAVISNKAALESLPHIQ